MTASHDSSARKGAKILIVSDAPFCHSFGFGVTLRTLFRSWRKSELFMIYPASLAGKVEIDREICERQVGINLPASGSRRNYVPFLLGQLPAWRERFSGVWLRNKLRSWRPDIVFTMTLTGVNLVYGDWSARKLGVRHVVLITDDFLTDQLPEEAIRAILRRADQILVISEEMRAAYEERYGVGSDVIHNGADEHLFGKQNSGVSNDVFTLRYIGGLDRNFHFGAIEDIVEAVTLLNREVPTVRFEIFGSAYNRNLGESLHNGKDVYYGGVISKDEGLKQLHSADLLVVPVSFDSPAMERYRLSFPTKLPECLATGRPTLIYGPSNCAAVRFCLRHGLGIVQAERSVSCLVARLTELLNASQTYLDRAKRDQEYILERYSSEAVGERFRRIMFGWNGVGSAVHEEDEVDPVNSARTRRAIGARVDRALSESE